jgi:hypothetical protein
MSKSTDTRRAREGSAVSRRCVSEPLEARRLLASSTFIYDQTPPYTAPHKLEFDLDTPVPASVSLNLSNQTSGETISTSSMTVSGNSVTFTFPDYNNRGITGALPDGNYYGQLIDDTASGPSILATADFFVWTADANHDRSVDTVDFNIMAAHWGATNAKFSQGDFSYDSTVDTTDSNFLGSNYGNTLPAPDPNGVVFLSPTSAEIDLDWPDSTATDVHEYTVYRSTDPNFTPSQSNLLDVTETSDYVDPGAEREHDLLLHRQCAA